MTPSTRSSRTVYGYVDPGPEPFYEDQSQESDVEMTMDEEAQESQEHYPVDPDAVNNIHRDRIVIAVDFGTTFSSVAYAVIPKGVSPDRIDLHQVRCIGNYPGYEPPPGVRDFRQDVPTELWYDYSLQESRAHHSPNGSIGSPPESENGDSSSSDEDTSPNDLSEFEDDGGWRSAQDAQSGGPCTSPVTQYWGYKVQQRLNSTNVTTDDARPLARFKLNLDRKKETDNVCLDVQMIVKALKKRNIIKNDMDIYTDYLTHLLRHSKEQLLLSKDLQSDMLVQFVLCVPAKWPMNACRVMQLALEKAVKAVELGEHAESNIHNLFMISEPEAAAECILAETTSELFASTRGETVVVVDAGGGTVDAVTYKCEHQEPLRLVAEVAPPDSRLCGASYINERFEKKLLQKLAGETYLIKNMKTLKSIVQARTAVFENYQKRVVDITKKGVKLMPIYIDDLRENKRKGFSANNLELRCKTMSKIFEDSLLGVKGVLENQLEIAESRQYRVEKVILTGGFGQSPSLQSYLRVFLEEWKEKRDCDIDLIVPENPSTAVARGAVLRALNMTLGPSRITQCSYGFLCSEPYQPESIEAHRHTVCRINKTDGEKYVDGTLRWVIKAGDEVDNMQTFSYEVLHTFPSTKKKLMCAEQLWMSDERHPDHYRKTHSENKGAEIVGTIEADLSFLIDKGHIQPQCPSEFSTHIGQQKQHWKVHYELAMIVQGRSIRFEARWPLAKDLQPGAEQDVLATKLVGIAAAFQPGTT